VAPAVAGTTVAKSGLIALKTARKLGKLPPWLGKAVVQSAKAVKQTKSLSSLTGILGDVNTLAKTRGGFNLMSKAKDAASLKRMATFAEFFDSNSATLYRIGGDLAVNVAQRSGKLGKNTIQLAATFGQGGLRVLERVGAVKFVKISSRASKMIHKGDIFYLLAWVLLMLPTWVLHTIVALGTAILIPWRGLSRLGNRIRRNHCLPIIDQALPGN
jgi:hypothetical protein